MRPAAGARSLLHCSETVRQLPRLCAATAHGMRFALGSPAVCVTLLLFYVVLQWRQRAQMCCTAASMPPSLWPTSKQQVRLQWWWWVGVVGEGAAAGT